jgi:cytochrome c
MFTWRKPAKPARPAVWRNPAIFAGAAAVLALAAGPAATQDGDWTGPGRAATQAEVAGWNIDIPVDGEDAPPGSGTAAEGQSIYDNACATCHGVFGEGAGRYPAVMGGEGTLDSDDPEKTVGSYWPYATTLWDYIHRAMPFGNAQSLSNDQTYAVTAYVLYLNDIMGMEEELNADNIADIEMPNRDGFIRPDPRPDVRIEDPCMSDCAQSVEITNRASDIGVTPDDRGHHTLVVVPDHLRGAETTGDGDGNQE